MIWQLSFNEHKTNEWNKDKQKTNHLRAMIIIIIRNLEVHVLRKPNWIAQPKAGNEFFLFDLLIVDRFIEKSAQNSVVSSVNTYTTKLHGKKSY